MNRKFFKLGIFFVICSAILNANESISFGEEYGSWEELGAGFFRNKKIE